jgi:hypothetical protein
VRRELKLVASFFLSCFARPLEAKLATPTA